MAYDKDWFDFLRQFDVYNEAALFTAIAILGKPSGFLDVGCGTGRLVEIMEKIIDGHVMGIEGPDGPIQDNVVLHDLNNPFPLLREFDLVWCTEVAEHLPEKSADTFADTVAKGSRKWIVFTAATPGQGGVDHLNEQEPEYWQNKFRERNFGYAWSATHMIREIWLGVTGPCVWLPKNIQVFRKK